METWADIHDELEFPVYGEVGPASIVTGEHPEFGAIIMVQTMEGATLISELPFEDEIDRQLAANDDAVRTIVAAATSRRRRALS